MTQNQNPKRSNSNGKAEEDMTARTQDWEARTLTATGSAAPGRYVMGQDAQLYDTRTGLAHRTT